MGVKVLLTAMGAGECGRNGWCQTVNWIGTGCRRSRLKCAIPGIPKVKWTPLFILIGSPLAVAISSLLIKTLSAYRRRIALGIRILSLPTKGKSRRVTYLWRMNIGSSNLMRNDNKDNGFARSEIYLLFSYRMRNDWLWDARCTVCILSPLRLHGAYI